MVQLFVFNSEDNVLVFRKKQMPRGVAEFGERKDLQPDSGRTLVYLSSRYHGHGVFSHRVQTLEGTSE